jgi:HNH endonuclease
VSLVLITDSAGTPKDWVNYELAACYYSRNKILWENGTKIKRFHGGVSAQTGEQSTIDISSIIGVSGPIFGHEFYMRETLYTERSILYARDRNLCAYCGEHHDSKNLTIDHVHPKSRGGKNTWVNCVTACKPCNMRKGNKTPEEAKMHLLYVPYAPNVFEKMILKNRKILADQMDFLIARVPKTSRIHLTS